MKLICYNKDCDNFGKEISNHSLVLRMGKDGLEPKYLIQCDSCLEPLKISNKAVLPENISTTFNKFKSSTEEQKKEMIKKRNALHQDKDEKRRAKTKRDMIIKDITENFEKHKKQQK